MLVILWEVIMEIFLTMVPDHSYFRQGGEQAINLEIPSCLTRDTVFHEVLHALGKGW